MSNIAPAVPSLPSPQYGPWPGVSVYGGPAFDQHFVERGLWQRRTATHERRYHIGLDYLTGQSKEPKGVLGNPNAMSYIETIDLANLDTIDEADTLSQQIQLWEDLGRHGLYTRLDLEQLGKIKVWGLRFHWGYDNPDDSGFMLRAWFSQDRDFYYSARDGVHGSRGRQQALLEEILRTPVNELDPTTFIPRDVTTLAPLYRPLDLDEILQNNLLNLNGLPLDDGTLQKLPDGTYAGGVTVPFDLEFRVDYNVETWGGSLNWMSTPIVRRSWLRVRPLVGIRYLQLRERLRFTGRDSGLTYGEEAGSESNADIKIHSLPNHFDDNRDFVIDNAGFDETTQQPQGQQQQQGQQVTVPSVPFIQFRDPLLSPFPITSFLENDIRSHLAGPEIGLQYDIGGMRFKISGHTKFALVANHTRAWMDGDNIAMITRDADLLPQTPEEARPNRFSDKDTHTTVSPLFEQSIFAELPIFGALPVIRRVPILQDATFRVGYTFLAVGLVARPSDSIVWQGNPREGLFPYIKMDRSTWTASYWSFALDWHY